MNIPKMVKIAGAASLFLTLFGLFFAIPKMINNAIKKEKGLRNGTLTRDMWEKFPHPLFFNVYVFNVTNPKEVQNGGTPSLQQIGPFVYDEYKWKVDTKDRNKDDTVQFRPVNTWYYNKEKSGALTGDEVVTIPHMLYLSMIMTVERDMPGTLPIISKALAEIFSKQDSIYMTVPIKDFLFEGILINCDVKEFAAKAVCSKLGEQVGKGIDRVGENKYKYSLFGSRNGTEGGLYRVKRGIKNVTDVGRVVEYNEKDRLAMWRGDACNNITGTDGSIFKPHFEEGEPMVLFAPDMCRSLRLDYKKTEMHREVSTYRYNGGFGDLDEYPEDICFCRTNETCPAQGSMELYKCNGSPIVVTLPHFFNTSIDYLSNVTGLDPKQELHEFVLFLEPVSGTPLSVTSRVQFNVEIHPVDKIDITKSLKTVLHPIFWMEEGIEIPQKYVDVIKNELLSTLSTVGLMKWSMLFISVGIIVGGYWLEGKAKEKSEEITSIEPYDEDTPKKMQDMVRNSPLIRY